MSIEGRRLATIAAIFAISAMVAHPASGQRKPPPTRADSVRDSLLSVGITAGEADDEPRPRALLKRLELNLGFTTFHLGGGVLADYIGYEQDSASNRDQFRLVSLGKLRDARILTGGTFLENEAAVHVAKIGCDAIRRR